MKPWLQDPDLTVYHGDALTVLAGLQAESVDMCVTSPPYWGLRDYGTGEWDGGDPDCDHMAPPTGGPNPARYTSGGGEMFRAANDKPYSDVCGKCGAQRRDRQLGLEPTPQEYVTNMVQVFAEVHRVLKDHGTLWVNMGDSYASDPGKGGSGTPNGRNNRGERYARPGLGGLKPKDLVGVPWRVAFALQADGWYLRSDIIWAKPNPMPESVTDRPTKAHEYVFLLAKQPRYFFDQEAVREPHLPASIERQRSPLRARSPEDGFVASHALNRAGAYEPNMAGRNIRSVWEIATQPYPEAHFATYPVVIPERCILAGTSERGVCPECGKPWERELESQRNGRDRNANNRAGGDRMRVGQSASDAMPRDYEPPRTLGWRPTCGHNQPPAPAVVLDPFAGAGTTAVAARKHTRHTILIELNEDYCKLIADRLAQQSLLAEGVA